MFVNPNWRYFDLRKVDFATAWQNLDDAAKRVAARMTVTALRHAYVAAHAALNQILSREVHVAPDGLRFERSRYGKPFLPDYPNCHFNLSHTRQDALVVWSCDMPVGVDIESPRSVYRWQKIAAKYFHPQEYRHILAAPVEKRQNLFLKFWVCKEAIVKAWGTGLAARPEAFALCLQQATRGQAITVSGYQAYVRLLNISDRFAALAVAGALYHVAEETRRKKKKP